MQSLVDAYHFISAHFDLGRVVQVVHAVDFPIDGEQALPIGHRFLEQTLQRPLLEEVIGHEQHERFRQAGAGGQGGNPVGQMPPFVVHPFDPAGVQAGII